MTKVHSQIVTQLKCIAKDCISINLKNNLSTLTGQ